jgi:hypothetical protein
LSVGVSFSSGILVVLGSFFALVPSVSSGFIEVLQSLVGVFEGGFGLGDLVVDASELSFTVSEV